MTPTSGAAQQNATDAYFGGATAHWSRVYAEEGLMALFYRERMRRALAWVDELRLDRPARVLEVGAGAGLLSEELARRGYSVTCSDSSAEMVAMASRRFEAAGLGDAIAVSVADVHELPHHSGTFELVFALGVLPWLHSPQHALRELGRVLVPGGHVIVSADNRLRLNCLFEPLENPLVAPLRPLWRAGKAIRGTRSPGPRWQPHTPAQVDGWLRGAGLEPDRRTTIGFGPFTFMSRRILSDRLGLLVHNRLDRIAERRNATLRRHGWHYLVSARRTDLVLYRAPRSQTNARGPDG